MTTMVHDPKTRDIVLLNASFEVLGKLSINKAARLLALGKAVVHEADETGRRLGEWAYPKVIRMIYFVKINFRKLHSLAPLSKHGVLVRDKFACAYCLESAKTVDHVQPQSRGGLSTWDNLVACCFPCNNRKDNRTPEEANMPLLWQPFAPTRAQLLGQ